MTPAKKNRRRIRKYIAKERRYMIDRYLKLFEIREKE
jgi:hypothetical protein